jgi:iron-sulfur cluster assembly accessory protein
MMNKMNLEISESALQHIKKIMAAKKDPVVFRLSVKETGCSGLMYVPEVVAEAKADDCPLQIADDFIIYVAKDSVAPLNGTVIDLKSQSLGQQQLVYNNPNAESLCGCGESFNLKEKAE